MYKNVLVCLAYLCTTLLGMMLIKIGHSDKPFLELSGIGVLISLRTMIGICFYGMSFLLFIFGISKLEISIAIPVVSGIYCIFTVIIGIIIFEEHVTIGQITGLFMIILGTVFVGVFK